jgi:RNAse (barnase) inhibitor barstar
VYVHSHHYSHVVPIHFQLAKQFLHSAWHCLHCKVLLEVMLVLKEFHSYKFVQVFRLPNPWTMAIINVLAELHREPDMKLNLKFEIEVLCKNLQIDINVSERVIILSTILMCYVLGSTPSLCF